MVELAMFCKLPMLYSSTLLSNDEKGKGFNRINQHNGLYSQQPGVQMPPPVRPPRRSNGAGGPQARGGTSTSSDDTSRNRRYRPY